MELARHHDGPTFGADSGRIFKSWTSERGRHEFRALLSVVVNPTDMGGFEDHYDQVVADLFKEYGLDRKRMVYKAHDIGKLMPGRPDVAEAFVGAFAQAMFDAPGTKYNFVYTHINAKALKAYPAAEEGRVTIYGEYGSGAERISANAFMDLINPYHHLLSSWFVTRQLGLKGARLWLDGFDKVRDCVAWRDLITNHHPLIVSKGDQTIPLLSTADILLRAATNELQRARTYVDENVLRSLLKANNPDRRDLYFSYLGNPHLNEIRPLNAHPVTNLAHYESHPIVFVSAGGTAGVAPIFEDTRAHEDALRHAAGIGAGVRFYDPAKDRGIIGMGDQEDYFMALNDPARHQLQALQATGRRVKPLNPSTSL